MFIFLYVVRLKNAEPKVVFWIKNVKQFGTLKAIMESGNIFGGHYWD